MVSVDIRAKVEEDLSRAECVFLLPFFKRKIKSIDFFRVPLKPVKLIMMSAQMERRLMR